MKIQYIKVYFQIVVFEYKKYMYIIICVTTCKDKKKLKRNLNL